MQFHATRASAASLRTGCAVVGVYEKNELSGAADRLDAAVGGTIRRVVKRGDFSGKLGEVLQLVELAGSPAERVLLVGLGPRSGFGRKAYRRAVTASVQWLARTGARDAVLGVRQLALEIGERIVVAACRSDDKRP